MTRLRTMFAATVLLAVFAMTAHASAEMPDQDLQIDTSPPAPDEATVLAIGRVCVSEANWRNTPDCAAIVERHLGVAERTGEPLIDIVREYSPRATGERPSSLLRMRWISTLRLDLEEPDGWRLLNAHRQRRGDQPLPWSRYEPRWAARLAEVRRLLIDPPDVCPGRIDHWGAQSLDRTDLGWIELRCGATPTVNRFWRVPDRGTRAASTLAT